MNNRSLQFASLLTLVLLAACSNSSETTRFIPVVATDQAIVYIYRPAVMANAIYSPDLYINEEFKLSLKSSSNTRVNLPTGEYTFEIEPDKNYDGKTRITLRLTAGDTYYLRVDSAIQLNDSALYKPYERSFDLTAVEPDLATRQISNCCINGKKLTDDATEMKPERQEPNDGFSVNKTQNPFSH